MNTQSIWTQSSYADSLSLKPLSRKDTSGTPTPLAQDANGDRTRAPGAAPPRPRIAYIVARRATHTQRRRRGATTTRAPAARQNDCRHRRNRRRDAGARATCLRRAVARIGSARREPWHARTRTGAAHEAGQYSTPRVHEDKFYEASLRESSIVQEVEHSEDF